VTIRTIGSTVAAPGLLLIATAIAGWAQTPPPYLHAPSVTDYATHDPNGRTILPTGRYIQPIGKHLPLARWPHGLVLSPDGRTAFVASEGVGQFLTDLNSPEPTVTAFSPGQAKRRSNAGGAAFSRDGKTLYWSSGESGEIHIVNVGDHTVTGAIALNVEVGGRKFEDSFAMDIQSSPDGSTLYVADVTNFRVVTIDTAQGKVVGSIDVGRYPYALAVSGKRVYVANIGVFAYSAIPQPTLPAKSGEKIDPRGLMFPPFGFPSKEARDGVEAEGRKVPGLGDPNAPESFSVWGIDVADPTAPKIVHRIKTGLLIGAPADNGKTVGGSAPNFLAVHGSDLYVSNGNNDTIERIDLITGKIVHRTRIQPSPLVAKLRGVGPSGMTLSPDGSRLYVAESGLNAIGVLDTKSGRMIGHIPTAWYPYRVALTANGKQLLCICFRGFGNGPNAGKNIPKSQFLGLRGVASLLNVPTTAELGPLTQKVLTYNGIINQSADRAKMAGSVVPTAPGKASEQIKYVVFITKENHSFDAIFDRVPGANGDPSLLRWGYHQTISAPGQPTLTDVPVMTNHNALARQFTLSDNFYMEPEASGVGHRWLVGVQPDNFCQMLYTLGWSFKLNSSAPGRRASFGSNGSLAPEDYPEAGSMWEHLAHYAVPFRNYGEGFEFAGVEEDEGERRTGAREVINMPMSKVLYDNTCREFPIFNMNIPDQYRAHWFEQDFTRLFLTKTAPTRTTAGRAKSRSKQPPAKPLMPRFVNIAICNDHGSGPKPAKGYPYVASWMADNDLALGRIVEFLSHTPYWKNMAIFVTQDDSGGEPDHIDAQRSVLLCISPWARRGYVSHRQTTIVSMHRTLYEILGLPPLNMFDALANDFSDCFTDKPDFRPYTVVPVDPRIFDPEKAKDPTDPEYKKARLEASILRDDPDEEERVLHSGGNK
jgi:YVTN family beta-propeller protein